jgi:hypothetical protein
MMPHALCTHMCCREDMRVAAYLAKSIAHMTLEPQLVEVSESSLTGSCDAALQCV